MQPPCQPPSVPYERRLADSGQRQTAPARVLRASSFLLPCLWGSRDHAQLRLGKCPPSVSGVSASRRKSSAPAFIG